jgi:hypothetical protein
MPFKFHLNMLGLVAQSRVYRAPDVQTRSPEPGVRANAGGSQKSATSRSAEDGRMELAMPICVGQRLAHLLPGVGGQVEAVHAEQRVRVGAVAVGRNEDVQRAAVSRQRP